jgi:hypothetical protein
MEILEAGVPDWQRTTTRYQRSKCEWRKTIALRGQQDRPCQQSGCSAVGDGGRALVPFILDSLAIEPRSRFQWETKVLRKGREHDQ